MKLPCLLRINQRTVVFNLQLEERKNLDWGGCRFGAEARDERVIESDLLYSQIEEATGLKLQGQRLSVGGVDVCGCVDLSECGGFCSIDCLGRLRGGKGGFGSLLRGQKGGKRKTTNIDACRDLSGVRIRHVRAAERLKEWMEKKKEEERIIAEFGGEEFTVSHPQRSPVQMDNSIIERYKKQMEVNSEDIKNKISVLRSSSASSSDEDVNVKSCSHKHSISKINEDILGALGDLMTGNTVALTGSS